MGYYVGLPLHIAMLSSAIVTIGELLAEIIGLDDNLVIPMLGVLGVRIALSPQFTAVRYPFCQAAALQAWDKDGNNGCVAVITVVMLVHLTIQSWFVVQSYATTFTFCPVPRSTTN